jgi:hypothetical protein
MRGPCRLGVRSPTEKSVLLLGLTAKSPLGEYTGSARLAEGEELGSNLLHVAQRTPASSDGSGSGKSATKRVLRPHFWSLERGVKSP